MNWDEVDAWAKRNQPEEKKPSRPATIFRPMTTEERELALALGACRFAPATFDKKFARDISSRAQAGRPTITDKQSAVLLKLAHRYRRQLGEAWLTNPTEE